MNSYFTPEFFATNRRHLRELFTGTAPIVLTAAAQLQRNADSVYPFRQDASFWYLTGIDEPDVVMVMDKDREYLIAPDRSQYQEIFDGGASTETMSARSGIQEVMTAKEGWKRLESRLGRVKHVATLAASPEFMGTHGMYANPARAKLIERLKQQPDIELLDLRQHLARMRMVKQAPELEAIRAAVTLTEKTLQKVTSKLSSYRYEYEIEAEIVANFIKHGAESAWKPIVASGANACLLHYDSNRSELHTGDLLVVDIGADVGHYAADITRTLTIGGEPNRRQQQVIDAVLEVQQYAANELRPGVTIADYEKRVEQFMGEKLRALGLIKVISRDNVRRFFPHATSHFLGIDPHDAGDYKRPLEPGVVLTVEPGIYIHKEKIGVRIEDDFVITESGCEPLSTTLPAASS